MSEKKILKCVVCGKEIREDDRPLRFHSKRNLDGR